MNVQRETKSEEEGGEENINKNKNKQKTLLVLLSRQESTFLCTMSSLVVTAAHNITE